MPTNSHEATDKREAKAGAAKRKEPFPATAGSVKQPSLWSDRCGSQLLLGWFLYFCKKKKKNKKKKSAPVLVQQGPAVVGTH